MSMTQGNFLGGLGLGSLLAQQGSNMYALQNNQDPYSYQSQMQQYAVMQQQAIQELQNRRMQESLLKDLAMPGYKLIGIDLATPKKASITNIAWLDNCVSEVSYKL